MLEKFWDHNDMLLVSSRSDRVHMPRITIYIILCLYHNMACILQVICIAYIYIIIPPYDYSESIYILVHERLIVLIL